MIRLPRLRRPAYTGANRCWPCTAVNAAILVLLVAAVAAFRPLGAALVGVAGSLVIWQRGYLVPFTPRFAPRLLASLPGVPPATRGRPSEHLDDLDGLGGHGVAPATVLEALVAGDVVVPADETLEVADDFAAGWAAEMDDLAAAPDDVLVERVTNVLAGISAARVERAGAETFLVLSGGRTGSTAWVRRPLAVAEVAAARALARTSLPAEHRVQAAHALCAFLETCPVCGAALVEGPASDCCGNAPPLLGRAEPDVLACERCGVAFYAFDPDADADADADPGPDADPGDR